MAYFTASRDFSDDHGPNGLSVADSAPSEFTAIDPVVDFHDAYVEIARDLIDDDHPSQPLTIGLVDLDQHDAITRALGARVAREVEEQVSLTLGATLRGSDSVKRIAPGRYLFMLRGNDLARGVLAAERMRKAVTHIQFGWEAKPIALTVSCGVSQRRPDDGAETLLSRIENAVHCARNEGSNCVIVGDFL